MQYLDVQVVNQALQWLQQQQAVWLCTVLATFGSSPRSPGAMLAAKADGDHVGSLSGGCVEENFLARLSVGEFSDFAAVIRYGDANREESAKISLPCGGILEVLVEKLEPTTSNIQHLQHLTDALSGQKLLLRQVDIVNSTRQFLADTEVTGPKIMQHTDQVVTIRIGPAVKLIIAGMSPVSEACASFAVTLGFEVIICDPRDDVFKHFEHSGVTTKTLLPSVFIASSGACHSATAIVALTHDPRIDDLTMMDAVTTPAFYIGVMGSHRSSNARAERLRASGGLSDEQIKRIHMPIGLALGSKTPAEIALAVMADVVRTLRGKTRQEL